MKKLFFLIIVLAVQTAFSQKQPVTVLSQKWYEKVNMRILNENDPFSAANSEIPVGANISSIKQTIGDLKTNKYFVYETVFKNESSQKIIGLAWDFVFYDSSGKLERSRKKFNLMKTIKKNKRETILETTTNPPDLVLNAKDYEKETDKPKEVIEVNCVVFEDRTTWKRPGADEKVCEDLRNQIKNREKRSKG